MQLGRGAFSKVFALNEEYAIKKFKGDRRNGISYDMIREVSILKNISSSFIIHLVKIDYEDFNYIVLPRYHTNLKELLRKHKLSKNEIKEIFFSICSGIYALHSSGIAHRDIKPSNVCISNIDFHYKTVLIDNGISRKLNYNRKTGDKTPEIITIWYRPPEVICEDKNYSFEIDVWSAGVILAEMCSGQHLFSHDNELLLLIAQIKMVGLPKNLSFRLPFQTFEYDTIGIEKFKKYGKKVFQCLTGMMEFDPLQRLSIASCLNLPYFDSLRKNLFKETKKVYDLFLEEWEPEHIYQKASFKARKSILIWMIRFCNNKSDSVYYLACNLFDKFCILNPREDMQLVAMGCLLIASKIEALTPLSIYSLLDATRNKYSKVDLLDMEKMILRKLDFNLLSPDLYNCYTTYIDGIVLNKDLEKHIRYYLHICTLFPDYLHFKPHILVGVVCFYCIGKKVKIDESCRIFFEKCMKEYFKNPEISFLI